VRAFVGSRGVAVKLKCDTDGMWLEMITDTRIEGSLGRCGVQKKMRNELLTTKLN